jgi:hypothetical protein
MTIIEALLNWKLFLLVATASIVHVRLHTIVLLIMHRRIEAIPSWWITNQVMGIFFPVFGMVIDGFTLTILVIQFFTFPRPIALITVVSALFVYFLVAPFMYAFFVQRLLRGIAFELWVNLIVLVVAVDVFFWR